VFRSTGQDSTIPFVERLSKWPQIQWRKTKARHLHQNHTEMRKAKLIEPVVYLWLLLCTSCQNIRYKTGSLSLTDTPIIFCIAVLHIHHRIAII
jgi:hypothetical protein